MMFKHWSGCGMYSIIVCDNVDFSEERNQLSRETFPRLQSYCQTLGLEFQVVDMRWGVRDENISYHQTSQVCIQEIQTCQRLSLGPSFLVCVTWIFSWSWMVMHAVVHYSLNLYQLLQGTFIGYDTLLLSLSPNLTLAVCALAMWLWEWWGVPSGKWARLSWLCLDSPAWPGLNFTPRPAVNLHSIPFISH